MKLLCRLIAPNWLMQEQPNTQRVLEGLFTDEHIKTYNDRGYNVYYLPNGPKEYRGGTVEGSQIDDFQYVFIDCDLKDGVYEGKDAFIAKVGEFSLPPTRIVDSGNGVHVYWKVADLDGMSYLRLSRRLMRYFNTDSAVGQIFQLMRLPNTLNTKTQGTPVPCEVLYEDDIVYTCEDLDKALPPISLADEQHCQNHYDKTYNPEKLAAKLDDVLPPKFGKLLRDNEEAKQLWADPTDDRSKSDYRLGHLMFANGFTKEEATSVLVNTAKALSRSPHHRVAYATNIVDKIWTFENGSSTDALDLSQSVAEILSRKGTELKGTRFRCNPKIDNTEHGFRLGQVIGLVAGSGVGKTSFALNMFRWFVQNNPDYVHFFVPLEQPANEIAERWQTLCGEDTSLHSKVQVLSNYDDNGAYRNLSFDQIKDHILAFQEKTGKKVGCVVIDHIGVLKKDGSKAGEGQDLMNTCHKMKAFAIQTNTLLVMQSQTSREKAGIGDLELNKDAAYGTTTFEWYCDYLITLWQPLKRCHGEDACPTITAFKFCKIRHKKPKRDKIKEDVPYYLYFDSDREELRDLTQSEKVAFDFFLPKATNKRKADRKTEVLVYQSVPDAEGVISGTEADDNRQASSH